jgi:hypothetical protein
VGFLALIGVRDDEFAVPLRGLRPEHEFDLEGSHRSLGLWSLEGESALTEGQGCESSTSP